MIPSDLQSPTSARTFIPRFGAMRIAEVFAVSAATCVIETVITADWLRGDITLTHALLAHTAVVGLMALWLYTLSLRGADLRHAASVALMTAVLGPYGAWGSLLALCVYALLRSKTRDIDEWYEALMPDLTRSLSQRIFDAIRSGAMDAGRDQGVASFIDVLALGTATQREALVAIITENFRPIFAPIILKALQHDDPAVRVIVATAVSQIMAKAHQQTEELKAQLVQHPNDPERLCALGLHLKLWADTGLLDVEQADNLRQSALDALMSSLELASDNEEAIVAIGNLLVCQGEYRDAIFWLELYPAVRDANPSAYLSYLEALYNLGELGDLRKNISTSNVALVFGRLQPDAQAALLLWLGSGKPGVPAQ